MGNRFKVILYQRRVQPRFKSAPDEESTHEGHRGQMLNQVSLLIIIRCSASPLVCYAQWGKFESGGIKICLPVLYRKFYDYCTFRNIYYCCKNYNFLTLT